MLIPIEKVLSKDEVRQFRDVLARATWQDGSQTAGTLARSVKQNQQLDDGSEAAVQLGNHVLRRLANMPTFISAALPKKIYPPKFNRYADGGTYGAHVDSAVMQVHGTNVTVRSDLSATLFLSEPEDYDGGELLVEDTYGVHEVKLPAGDLILYPASSLHQVTPVTRGARTSSFFWIQSMIRDDARRALLFQMDIAIQQLSLKVGAGAPELVSLTGTYHNLLRMWAEV